MSARVLGHAAVVYEERVFQNLVPLPTCWQCLHPDTANK